MISSDGCSFRRAIGPAWGQHADGPVGYCRINADNAGPAVGGQGQGEFDFGHNFGPVQLNGIVGYSGHTDMPVCS